MWVLKLKLEAKNQLLGSLAMKHEVSMTGYPLSYWKDKKFLYLMTAGFMFGEKKNKKALVRDVKKMSDFLEFEVSEDFVISVSKQPLFSEPAYNPKIIRVEPAIINKTGYHIWNLASFDRKALEEVLRFTEKYLGASVLYFRKESVSNISFTRLLPELTGNQKRALEIAINNGYYEYPKNIKMEKLAKKMGISYSTYQAHLKKAEGKLIPFMSKNL